MKLTEDLHASRASRDSLLGFTGEKVFADSRKWATSGLRSLARVMTAT